MRVIEKIMLYTAIYSSTSAGFSCANKSSQLLFNSKNSSGIIHTTIPQKTYRIQVQDLLQIRNLQNRKYLVDEPIMMKAQPSGSESQTYEVEPDSTIALPLLGHIKIAGLSRSEAARYIEMLYQKELKDPIIALKIMNLKVTILGEVRQQGVYNLVKDETSLIEAIGAAGGLTDKGNSKNIKIIRRDQHSVQTVAFDLSDMKTLSSPGIILQNNDIVYVAKNSKAIRSEKLQSIAAILQPVTSLLNTAWIMHTLTR